MRWNEYTIFEKTIFSVGLVTSTLLISFLAGSFFWWIEGKLLGKKEGGG